MSVTHLSRLLSLVLRHRPDQFGLRLEASGWLRVEALLEALAAHGQRIDLAALRDVVANNNKQRFEFDASGARIRARQGHSVDVDLGYRAVEPPELLYHGTVARLLPAIRRDGLCKMRRHAVHLSGDVETAVRVGARRGEPVILVVRARELAATGAEFFCTENKVWLTEHVPAGFVEFPA